ncbi:MAG: TIGR03905 family TSCPD domain-containing protein [Ruminococcus sp.]|nr:TIGR03905 family TSCPD domain-containing protein [Ruminococcus sp.]
MKHTYIPRGVCSRMIEVEIEDDIITSCRFMGGCSGNTQGVSKLVLGMDANDAIERLKGIDCGGRGTSCPDQLANALEEALELM